MNPTFGALGAVGVAALPIHQINMPSFTGQALAGCVFVFWGLCAFYRWLALVRVCRCAVLDRALTAASLGGTQTLFALLAIGFEVSEDSGSSSSTGASAVFASLEHRAHLLAYLCFALAGLAQLLTACACLPLHSAFRLASPAASLLAAALLLTPPYATPAESMAFKLLAASLIGVALAEFAALPRRRDPSRAASGSASAAVVQAIFSLHTGVFFLYTAYFYYFN